MKEPIAINSKNELLDFEMLTSIKTYDCPLLNIVPCSYPHCSLFCLLNLVGHEAFNILMNTRCPISDLNKIVREGSLKSK